MKTDYWALRFSGISDDEFHKLSNSTTLPIRYNFAQKTMYYEWQQYAKSELGICADMLFNSHGPFKWLSRRTQVEFEDGLRISIVCVSSMNKNY